MRFQSPLYLRGETPAEDEPLHWSVGVMGIGVIILLLPVAGFACWLGFWALDSFVGVLGRAGLTDNQTVAVLVASAGLTVFLIGLVASVRDIRRKLRSRIAEELS